MGRQQGSRQWRILATDVCGSLLPGSRQWRILATDDVHYYGAPTRQQTVADPSGRRGSPMRRGAYKALILVFLKNGLGERICLFTPKVTHQYTVRSYYL
jgi:hypothetical protein